MVVILADRDVGCRVRVVVIFEESLSCEGLSFARGKVVEGKKED